MQHLMGKNLTLEQAGDIDTSQKAQATYEELKRIYMDNKAAISQEIYAAKNRGIEKEKMQNSKISIASRVWN